MAVGQRYFFHPLDYVLLVVSLVTSLGVGIYQAHRGRRDSTTAEYLLGGRRFSMFPVALSLVASFISSIALVGIPAEVHFYGIQTVFSFIGLFFATLLSGALFVPLFHPLKITSVQEYLEMRFNSRSVRLFGTATSLIGQLFYTGCVVYGQAAALEATTGLPYWASILLVNVLGTIYTSVGGMKAVIWTDVFQVSVMFFSMISIIIIGTVRVGGVSRTWNLNYEWGRIFVDWDLGVYSRMTFWSSAVTSMVGWTNTYSVCQTAVQRYCAVPEVSQARKSMYMNALGTAFFCTVCALVGMVTFAYYAFIQCDPYADHQISNANQILPLFIMEVLSYPGLPGLFVSGLFSGSLSTISSNISSMCAVFWEDVLKPHIGHKLTPRQQVTCNKLIAAGAGLAGLGITFLVHNVGGSLLQIAKSLFGICSGPGLGIFVLGALFPWTNWIGALSGGIASVVFVLWIFIGQIFLGSMSKTLPLPTSGCHLNETFNGTLTTVGSATYSYVTSMTTPTDVIPTGRSFLDEWFYSISYMWYGVIGITICLIVGVVVSFLTGATDPSTVEKRLLFSFIRKYYGKETTNEKESKDQKSLNPLLSASEKNEKNNV